MDVREKLVELLGNLFCGDYGIDGCDSCKYNTEVMCSAHACADRLIANGVTVQEWIPVSEPPKETGTYIVCTDKGGILLGHWYGKEWNVGGGAKKHLAYWMKKPEPPKGE